MGVSLEMSSPAIANGVVYIGGWYGASFDIAGSLYAVNEQTGQEVGVYLDSLGFSSSPCVNDGRLYISADDGNLYAINAATGAILWQRDILPNGASAAVSGANVYIGGTGTDYIYALNKETGAEIWKVPTAEQTTSTPVIGRTAKRRLSIAAQ